MRIPRIESVKYQIGLMKAFGSDNAQLASNGRRRRAIIFNRNAVAALDCVRPVVTV